LGKLYGRRLTVYGGRQQQFQAEGKQRWEVRPVVTNGDMGAVVVHSGLAEVLAVTRGWRWLVMCGQQRGAHKTGKWRTTSAVSGLVVALHRLEAHTAQQQPPSSPGAAATVLGARRLDSDNPQWENNANKKRGKVVMMSHRGPPWHNTGLSMRAPLSAARGSARDTIAGQHRVAGQCAEVVE
jgi:hypothetical protein